MGAPKGKLFELAEMFHTYQNNKQKDDRRKSKKRVSLKGKHFDEGKSISLTYDLDMYPEVLYESHQRQAPALQMSFWNDERSEAFYVEPFEMDEASSAFSHSSAAAETLLDKVVKKSAEETTTPVTAQHTPAELEKKLDLVVSPEGHTAPAQQPTTESVPKVEQSPAAVSSRQETIKTPETPGKTGEAMKPYDVSDEEFARDIGAILQGQKIYDKEQKKAIDKGGHTSVSKPSASQAPPAKDDPMDPAKNEHKIFEKIAQSMQYANSYDLGSIALDKRFEEVEEELEKEEVDRLLQNTSRSQEKEPRPKDPIEELTPPPRKKPPTGGDILLTDKYGSKIALDDSNGGRLISIDDLQKGDLILASPGATDTGHASESTAALYLGGQQVLTRSADDTLEERKLDTSGTGVLAVLRHSGMSAEKASTITTTLGKLGTGGQQEKWLRITCPAISIHPDVCNQQSSTDKGKCGSWSGKIQLGTTDNGTFMCAQSITDAFKNNQVPFASPANEHNGTLKYFGHLKNK